MACIRRRKAPTRRLAKGSLSFGHTASFAGLAGAHSALAATEGADTAGFAGLAGAIGTLGATEAADAAGMAGSPASAAVLA